MAIYGVLEASLRELAHVRQQYAETLANCNQIMEQISQTELGQLHEREEQRADELRSKRTQVEKKIREELVRIYEQSGDKSPAHGGGIRVRRLLSYDAQEACDWCRANAPALLTLDAKRFDQVAEVLGAPVELVEEPQATISRDLSDWLEG